LRAFPRISRGGALVSSFHAPDTPGAPDFPVPSPWPAPAGRQQHHAFVTQLPPQGSLALATSVRAPADQADSPRHASIVRSALILAHQNITLRSTVLAAHARAHRAWLSNSPGAATPGRMTSPSRTWPHSRNRRAMARSAWARSAARMCRLRGPD